MKKSLLAFAALAMIGESSAAGWSRQSSDEPSGHELRALNAGGLLANIDSPTLKQNVFMQAFGQGIVLDGNIALAANPPAADVIRLMIIPAGTKVSSVILGNGDLDANAGPTITFSLGYAPVVAGDGPAANATYFGAAGDTALQAPNLGKVYGNFDAITFDKDVYLTLTIGVAAATFAAGSIRASVHGEARGVK